MDPSQTAAIQGIGPVGMCHTLVCNFFGIINIIGIDKISERLEKGKRLGLTDTIDMNEYTSMGERQKLVMKMSGGEGGTLFSKRLVIQSPSRNPSS